MAEQTRLCVAPPIPHWNVLNKYAKPGMTTQEKQIDKKKTYYTRSVLKLDCSSTPTTNLDDDSTADATASKLTVCTSHGEAMDAEL